MIDCALFWKKIASVHDGKNNRKACIFYGTSSRP